MSSAPWRLVAAVVVVVVAAGVVAPYLMKRGSASAVRAAYSEYEAARRSGDATKVAALIGPETRDWIMQMHRAAAKESAAQVRARPLVEQFVILDLRQRLKKGEIDGATEEAALADYARRESKPREKEREWEALRVEIEGDRATASLGWKHEKGERYAAHDVVFSRSGDAWRFNPHTMEAAIMASVGGILDRRMMERVIVETWPEEYGAPFDPALWDGPRE
jgi:hypothetical protein